MTENGTSQAPGYSITSKYLWKTINTQNFKGLAEIVPGTWAIQNLADFDYIGSKIAHFLDLAFQNDRNRGLSSLWQLYYLKIFMEDYQHTKFKGVSLIFS